MATKATKKGIKIMVKPATDNAYKEGYAKANGKVIPFDVPIIVEQSDVRALQRMKEPKKVSSKSIDVRNIMNQMQISQEKANKVARMSERENMQNGQIRYTPKYFVQII